MDSNFSNWRTLRYFLLITPLTIDSKVFDILDFASNTTSLDILDVDWIDSIRFIFAFASNCLTS